VYIEPNIAVITSPAGAVAKYFDECVCLCVCLSDRISLEPHARSLPNILRMLPISVGMLTIGRIAYRREGGDGSAERGRSVIYDCLVVQASDTAFVCPVCVQRFSTSKALMRHQAQLHGPAVHPSSHGAGRKVTCAICTVDFANERELLAHLVGAQHKDMKARRLRNVFLFELSSD